MSDQMPMLDVRLSDYFDTELRRAERDFPLMAKRQHPARRSRRAAPAIALVGVLIVALAAGTWTLITRELGGTGGSGWTGVEALGLTGEPMTLAILDADEVIDARRPVTAEELAAHQQDPGSARIALAPLTGDEWLLTWLGAPCDVSGILTVSRTTLTITMDPRPACGDEPLVRGAVLTFAPSIQPGGLALKLVDPPAPLTKAEAIAAAKRQATIAGPLAVGDVAHGSYGSLWQGSTSNLPAEGTPPPQVNPDVVVWRIDLSGPSGREQLYIDEFSGQVVDAIWQGN